MCACVRVCVCVCVRACVCVCVLHDNTIMIKINRSRNMKLEYIVFVNSLDKFDIEHCRNKVKVTVGLQKFPHLPQYKLSGPKLNFGTS